MNDSGKITIDQIENLLNTAQKLKETDSSISSVTVDLNSTTKAILVKDREGEWYTSIKIEKADGYYGR